jgi:predicted transcriptional regulator
VETLESDQAVVSALGLMRELGVRAVVVTENEEPIGVVEQRHIVEAAEEALLSPLKPFVRAGLIKLPGETPLCEALEKAHAEERRYIFCLADEDTRRGILTPSNVTAAIAGATTEG